MIIRLFIHTVCNNNDHETKCEMLTPLTDILSLILVHSYNRKTKTLDSAMDQQNLDTQFKEQFNDVVSRLQSKQLFQSDWDIASFAVFFIFIGMVLLLVILVLIRCCCCCCCDEKPRTQKVGIENLALDP